MNVLALECSTQSAKAILYDDKLGVQDVVSLPFAPEASDVITQDAEAIYDTLCACTRELAGRNPDKKIACIGLSFIWHSLLLLDEGRKPLGRISTWANTAAGPLVARYRTDGHTAKWSYAKTGCLVHSMYPLWQWLYLCQTQPELTQKARYISCQASYIYERLTGDIAYSKCVASGSSFMNIHTLDWDEDILEFAGLTKEQLPPLKEACDTMPLSQEAAAQMGLPFGIPVCVGGADGALNQVGSGAMKPGVMTFSVGTSGAIRLAVDAPVLPENPATWCYYIADGKRIAGAATSGAGNCVNWFVKDLLGGRLSFSELEQAIAQSDTQNAPIFLPFLYGERCPGGEDSRKGGFVQVEGSHGVGQLYYALLEGVLMNVYQCYKILNELGSRAERISITGGIVHSPVWLQLAADLFGKAMETSTQEHASTMGAVALALKAAGSIARLEEFEAPAGTVIEPDMTRHTALQERYRLYLDCYNKSM